MDLLGAVVIIVDYGHLPVSSLHIVGKLVAAMMQHVPTVLKGTSIGIPTDMMLSTTFTRSEEMRS